MCLAMHSANCTLLLFPPGFLTIHALFHPLTYGCSQVNAVSSPARLKVATLPIKKRDDYTTTNQATKHTPKLARLRQYKEPNNQRLGGWKQAKSAFGLAFGSNFCFIKAKSQPKGPSSPVAYSESRLSRSGKMKAPPDQLSSASDGRSSQKSPALPRISGKHPFVLSPPAPTDRSRGARSYDSPSPRPARLHRRGSRAAGGLPLPRPDL